MSVSRRMLTKSTFAVAGFYLLSHLKVSPAMSTEGGLRGQTIVVTSLNDNGPGTLRAALTAHGPRRIVFAVSGEIWIRDTLSVFSPHVTVEGQTAPSPGITVLGDRIRIRANDVIFRNIRLRVGALKGSDPQNRDGFTIDGSMDGKRPISRVVIENCSVSWSVDEALQIWGPNTRDVTVRNCIFSEALDKSIHPKGDHSMGAIIGPATKNVLFERNLFAHNQGRNPVVSGGAEAVIINNLIFNPGYAGIHFYPSLDNPKPTLAAIIGNVVIAGHNTKSTLAALDHGINAGSMLYYDDNVAIGVRAFDIQEHYLINGRLETIPLVSKSPLNLPDPKSILHSDHVFGEVLLRAGARPRDRDDTDNRIIAEVKSGTGAVRDFPPDPRLNPTSSLRKW